MSYRVKIEITPDGVNMEPPIWQSPVVVNDIVIASGTDWLWLSPGNVDELVSALRRAKDALAGAASPSAQEGEKYEQLQFPGMENY